MASIRLLLDPSLNHFASGDATAHGLLSFHKGRVGMTPVFFPKSLWDVSIVVQEL